jgi:hypothetical protein
MLKEDWVELAPNVLNGYKSKDYTDFTISKLNHLIEAWVTKRETITASFESVFGKLLLSLILFLL